jgi:tetratricopeptide (TPR) repeat protein
VAPLAIAGALLGLHTIYRAHVTRSAEQTFVADGSTLDDRIEAIQRAIKLNPNESYYQQQLGSMLGDMARQLRRAAQQSSDPAKQRPFLDRANQKINEAEVAIYASLPHAWAPENIFISLFTLYYQRGQLAAAEAALERALEHSPHLGPVRANLAVLKVERGAFKEAMADVEWVLEVEPNNTLALKTGGRAALGLGDYARARALLEGAKTKEPNDKQVLAALDELARKTSTTATASAAP